MEVTFLWKWCPLPSKEREQSNDNSWSTKVGNGDSRESFPLRRCLMFDILLDSLFFFAHFPCYYNYLITIAIWEELQGPVHAVDSMVCKTPDE